MPTSPSGLRRPLKTGALLTAAATVAALLAPTPANADPCWTGADGKIHCFRSGAGGSTGGGNGTGGGDGGGGEMPTLPTDRQGLGVGGDQGGAPAPAPPATIDLAEMARSEIGLPTPHVNTAPASKTYVRVKTALWVDNFAPRSTVPITVAGQTIQATATPRSVEWNLGETKLNCAGPGSKDGATCSYTYRRSSTGAPGGSYRITATIVWGVQWTCEGGPCDAPGGTLEDMTMTSEPEFLTVSEIQTNTQQ